jgi:hypothetical protein
MEYKYNKYKQKYNNIKNNKIGGGVTNKIVVLSSHGNENGDKYTLPLNVKVIIKCTQGVVFCTPSADAALFQLITNPDINERLDINLLKTFYENSKKGDLGTEYCIADGNIHEYNTIPDLDISEDNINFLSGLFIAPTSFNKLTIKPRISRLSVPLHNTSHTSSPPFVGTFRPPIQPTTQPPSSSVSSTVRPFPSRPRGPQFIERGDIVELNQATIHNLFNEALSTKPILLTKPDNLISRFIKPKNFNNLENVDYIIIPKINDTNEDHFYSISKLKHLMQKNSIKLSDIIEYINTIYSDNSILLFVSACRSSNSTFDNNLMSINDYIKNSIYTDGELIKFKYEKMRFR